MEFNDKHDEGKVLPALTFWGVGWKWQNDIIEQKSPPKNCYQKGRATEINEFSKQSVLNKQTKLTLNQYIQNVLGFYPRWNYEKFLKYTLIWFFQNLEGWSSWLGAIFHALLPIVKTPIPHALFAINLAWQWFVPVLLLV